MPHRYLDGRFIKLALRDLGFNCYCPKAIHLNLVEKKDSIESYNIYMDSVKLLPSLNAIRVVTKSQYFSHSSLVLFDASTGNVWWWNPRIKSQRSDAINAVMKTLVHDFMRKNFMAGDLTEVKGYVEIEESAGLCNALVLKFLVDWMNDHDFDYSDLESFAEGIRSEYGYMLSEEEGPDIEYDVSTGGALLGGLGGAMIGGALGGTGGAMLGGLGGAMIGSGAGGFSRTDAKVCNDCL